MIAYFALIVMDEGSVDRRVDVFYKLRKKFRRTMLCSLLPLEYET